jgi:predicted transcriptional regulator of viral defense system
MSAVTKIQGTRFDRAIAIFRNNGGILRTAQAMRMGIHPSTLYTMRDTGSLETVSRGVYRLPDAGPLGDPDLVTVATRIPNGVICLISALAFHEITTQIPHEIYVALQRGSEKPRLNQPPIKIYRFSGRAFTDGVEVHEIDGVNVKIYNVEKTLADCFKFRNKIGLDTAVEAVRFYRERKSVNVDALMHFAKICRVEKVMRPYLEAIL